MAVNFSVDAVIKGVKLLPSSHRRSACNVPTNGKIHITTALCEGKAHVQLYLRVSSTNESATSVKFIKIRNRLIFSCYFNYRVPDSRNPLRVLFQFHPSSEVVRFPPLKGEVSKSPILTEGYFSVLQGCTDERGLP